MILQSYWQIITIILLITHHNDVFSLVKSAGGNVKSNFIDLQVCSNKSILNNRNEKATLDFGKNNSNESFYIPAVFTADFISINFNPRFPFNKSNECKDGIENFTALLYNNGKENSCIKVQIFSQSFIPLSRAFVKSGIFDRNGILRVGRNLYEKNEYCIDHLNSKQARVKICSKIVDTKAEECSEEQPCIRKCCKQNEIWDINSGSCELSFQQYWTPYFYRVDEDCVVKIPLDLQDGNTTEGNDIRIMDGLPKNCILIEDRHTIPSTNIPDHALGRFRILVNGSVLVNKANGLWQELWQEDYCVDQMRMRSEDPKGTQQTYKGDVLLVCKEELKLRGPKPSIPIKYALMLFGAALILFMTAIVYLLLWDKHNIYEWTVFFEVISMFFMIISVALAHTIARDPTEGNLGSKHCRFIGVIANFFFLSTFFWLLVINFEIWWNFRTLTIRNKKSRRLLRLMNYHLFAWGCPLLMIVIGLILDSKYGLQNEEIDCSNIIVPNYGQLNCYISKQAQGPYLYYPIGVILGFNLLFYTLTIFKMCGYQKTSQAMIKNRSNGNFQPVVVFARLFIVMGVSWISEILAWALSPKGHGTIPVYWIVFDIVTLVQAIAIFTIFICRKETLRKLLEKYPLLTPLLSPLTKLSCCSLNPTHHPVQQLTPKSIPSTEPSVEDYNKTQEDQV